MRQKKPEASLTKKKVQFPNSLVHSSLKYFNKITKITKV